VSDIPSTPPETGTAEIMIDPRPLDALVDTTTHTEPATKNLAEAHRLYLHTKLTIDSLMACALLRLYYPGADRAPLHLADSLDEEFTPEYMEREGILAVSFMGKGQFPYQVVDKRLVLLTDRVLDVLKLPSFLDATLRRVVFNEMFGQKNITAALRTTDAQSTALSQMLTILRSQGGLPAEKLAALLLPLMEAFIRAESQKGDRLASDYRAAYQQGRVDGLTVYQGKRLLRCVIIKSSLEGMASWLFNAPEVLADVVVQVLPRGYVLIVAKPNRDIKLLDVVSVLRVEEARVKRYPFDKLDRTRLTTTGRLEGVEEWYFNSMTNSINNGGFTDKRTLPTSLSLVQIKHALNVGLNFSSLADECPRHSCIYKKCSFYPYNFFRCHKIRKYGDKALVGESVHSDSSQSSHMGESSTAKEK